MKDQLSCASYLICHQFTLLLQRMKRLEGSRRWNTAVPFWISASTALGMYETSCFHQLGLPRGLSHVSSDCYSSLVD